MTDRYHKEIVRRRVVVQKIASLLRIDLSLEQSDRFADLLDELANGGRVVRCECGEPLRLVEEYTPAVCVVRPQDNGKPNHRDCPNREAHAECEEDLFDMVARRSGPGTFEKNLEAARAKWLGHR